MSFVLNCTSCGMRLTLGDDRVGDIFECPNCEARVRVPAEKPPSSKPVPVPPPLPPKRTAPKPPPLPTVRPKPQPLSLDEEAPAADPVPTHSRVSRRTAVVAGGSVFALACLGLVGWAIRRSGKVEERPTSARVPLMGEQVYQRLIRSTVLIATKRGTGSGFVVDAGKRLIVTNYHVVLDEPRAAVVFPLYDGRGDLVTDASKYDEEKARDVVSKGEVIGRKESCDLALIRAERLADRTVAVALARQAAATGSIVYSIGGSGASDNLLWRLTKGTVRGRVKRQQRASFGHIDAMILETDAPVNPGDSGGPVVNDRGELVAVVAHFLTQQRQVSGNIDVDEVRSFIAQQPSSRE